MAWTNSKVFRAWVSETLLKNAATGYGGLEADTIKAALYDDANTTPNQDAATASTGYATGVWTTSEPPQQFDAAGWGAGGLALTWTTQSTDAVTTPAAGTTMFTAQNRASTANVTINLAAGAFVYDDTITAGTIADQGICYNYFGGTASVTSGTFTVVWHANGIFRIA
jgi:hypothetical protein